jgi:tetratricopeptide (TPR) repeat protein
MAEDTISFANQRVAFLGRLGGVSRREAYRLVRQQRGQPIERCELPLDVVVIGANELPLTDDTLLDPALRDAADRGLVEIISETQFWQRLGLVENEQHVRRLYTPVMLAQLLNVSVSIIRRWHRRRLIVPVREVHRLPYFDFQEVATARQLAELLGAGVSPATIERKLAELARWVPDVDRPLAQLSIIVEGRQLLLRQGEGLIDPDGQMRFDFQAAEQPLEDSTDPSAGRRQERLPPSPHVIPIGRLLAQEARDLPSVEQMVAMASDLEDAGQLPDAMETYRTALMAGGPSAELCFRLAELLYMTGDVSAARERYAMAIELDENYVEARANLGCVLWETGAPELAVAAFQGALHLHPGYPDGHYHLARLLDSMGQPSAAEAHWQEFVELAPDSPWADEARQRLAGEE